MKIVLLACWLVAGATFPAASQGALAPLPASLTPEVAQPASPLKIQGAGTVLGDPTVPGGADFLAAGTASHLGSWTNEGVLAIDPASGATTGAVVFTAANGDQLIGVFLGTFDPATGTALATFQWTGGTGRFVSASGSADFAVQQDPTGEFTFEAEGTLEY